MNTAIKLNRVVSYNYCKGFGNIINVINVNNNISAMVTDKGVIRFFSPRSILPQNPLIYIFTKLETFQSRITATYYRNNTLFMISNDSFLYIVNLDDYLNTYVAVNFTIKSTFCFDYKNINNIVGDNENVYLISSEENNNILIKYSLKDTHEIETFNLCIESKILGVEFFDYCTLLFCDEKGIYTIKTNLRTYSCVYRFDKGKIATTFAISHKFHYVIIGFRSCIILRVSFESGDFKKLDEINELLKFKAMDGVVKRGKVEGNGIHAGDMFSVIGAGNLWAKVGEHKNISLENVLIDGVPLRECCKIKVLDNNYYYKLELYKDDEEPKLSANDYYITSIGFYSENKNDFVLTVNLPCQYFYIENLKILRIMMQLPYISKITASNKQINYFGKDCVKIF